MKQKTVITLLGTDNSRTTIWFALWLELFSFRKRLSMVVTTFLITAKKRKGDGHKRNILESKYAIYLN